MISIGYLNHLERRLGREGADREVEPAIADVLGQREPGRTLPYPHKVVRGEIDVGGDVRISELIFEIALDVADGFLQTLEVIHGSSLR